MKRKQIPQISYTSWYSKILRDCMHEFMTWFVNKVKAAHPFLPVVNEGLTHANRVVAIQADVGAGFETLAPLIDPHIERVTVPLENFKADEKGLYILVNTFHQLNADKARDLLKKISDQKQPLVIVEGNNDSPWQVFGMTVLVPLTVLLTAPFVKPFRLSRILFTYFIPILPIVTLVDGFLALFKLYAPGDLDELLAPLQSEHYHWRSGKMKNGRGGKIIYLIGWPEKIED